MVNSFIKKYLRRKVRVFVYACIANIAVSFVFIPILVYILYLGIGTGSAHWEEIKFSMYTMAISFYLLGFFLIPTMYIQFFSYFPEFSLDKIETLYESIYHKPLIINRAKATFAHLAYLQIRQPITPNKVFRIYSNLYVNEIYGGQVIETNSAREMTNNLKKQIPNYEYL